MIACTLKAETSGSDLTQYKLFTGDDKNTLFGVTFSFKKLHIYSSKTVETKSMIT